MRQRLWQFALLVAAGAVFVLLLERQKVMPELAAEREQAARFANVIAECANNHPFWIDAETLVRCRRVKTP